MWNNFFVFLARIRLGQKPCLLSRVCRNATKRKGKRGKEIKEIKCTFRKGVELVRDTAVKPDH